jgi:hypothetical protein
VGLQLGFQRRNEASSSPSRPLASQTSHARNWSWRLL